MSTFPFQRLLSTPTPTMGHVVSPPPSNTKGVKSTAALHGCRKVPVEQPAIMMIYAKAFL